MGEHYDFNAMSHMLGRKNGIQDKLVGEKSISVSLLPIHLLTAIHDKRRL